MSSVIISGLSHQAGGDRSLFSNLDLTFGAERTGLVGRNGVGKSTLLKLISGEWPVQSGHIGVGGTVGVLHQTVQSAQGTVADLFGVREALSILRRAESGQADADDLSRADWTLEARTEVALAAVGLSAQPETALAALSGGQQTRAALAALVFSEPDFLLLDEPTNNLDHEGRQAVHELLGKWRKGAIVVSHDRELLERMDAIVELTSLGATRYGGNWSQYRARKAIELEAAQQQMSDAEKRMAEVARDTQATAERQARRDGAGRRKAAKGDMPKILLGMRKDRSEQTGGANARLAERMKAEAAEVMAQAREKIDVLTPLYVSIASTGLPVGRTVLKLENVQAGYGGRTILDGVSLTISGPERVAVTGPNGSGKTTLLAVVTGKVIPTAGRVWVTRDAAFLDQQVSLLDPDLSIRDNFRRLQAEADENACRAALARFMFRADAALQIVGTLSGGQMLRAGLACVLGGARPPDLLILDEPTNHLDIEAIEAVEAGLRAYDGALLVVSHDEAFLDAIGVTRRISVADMKNP